MELFLMLRHRVARWEDGARRSGVTRATPGLSVGAGEREFAMRTIGLTNVRLCAARPSRCPQATGRRATLDREQSESEPRTSVRAVLKASRELQFARFPKRSANFSSRGLRSLETQGNSESSDNDWIIAGQSPPDKGKTHVQRKIARQKEK